MYRFAQALTLFLPLRPRKMAATNPKTGADPMPPPPPAKESSRRTAHGLLTGPAAKTKADPPVHKAPVLTQTNASKAQGAVAPSTADPPVPAGNTDDPPPGVGGTGNTADPAAVAPRGVQANTTLASRFAASLAGRIAARTRRATSNDARTVTPPCWGCGHMPSPPCARGKLWILLLARKGEANTSEASTQTTRAPLLHQ